MTRSTPRWHLRPLVLAVALGSNIAYSQTEKLSEEQVEPKQATRALEEVIVSAQKVEQSSQDVPISLTAVSGDMMRDLGGAGLQDIAPYIPNVRFSSDTDPALAQINIRGFGSNPLNAAFESSVGFVQDEVFFARPSYYNEAIFDVARVEVLRGPQGTLFGKNTVAGVFNVTTQSPTEEFSGFVQATQSDPDEIRLEGAVGGAITDWMAVRFSAMDIDKEGQLYNQFLDRYDDKHEQDAQRLKIDLTPTENISVELLGVVGETSANYWGLQLQNLDDGTRAFLQNYDPNIEDDPYNHRTSYDQPGFITKDSQTLSAKMDWYIGKVGAVDELTSTIVVADTELNLDSLVDLDTSPADLGRLTVASQYEQQSFEWRFSGSSEGLFGLGERLDFVAGAFLFQSNFAQQTQIIAGDDLGAYLTTDDVLQLASGNSSLNTGGLLGALNLAGLPIATLTSAVIGDDRYVLDYLLDVEAGALFGQFSWYLDEHWVITPGLRYSKEKKNGVASGQASCAQAALSLPCIMGTALSAENYNEPNLERTETDLSPKLSVQYYINNDTNLFVTYSRGFKSGGFNASSFGGEDLNFEPENATTIEGGLKGEFFNNTLRLNAVAYRTYFDDLQVLAFNGAFFDVTNAASAISDGVELDFTWLTPLPILQVSGSVGLLDARYEDYPDAPAPIAQGNTAKQDLSNRRISLAPKQTASLTPNLQFPLFGLAASTSVDFLYQGDQYTDGDLDPATFLPGYTTISARFSLASLEQGWVISVGGSNLTDEKISGQTIDTVFFPGSYNSRQKSQRKVFASLMYNW
ncbi:TonB-dependent receptor [Spongiibacter sp. KMU-158]|uniref:TonB-dependent receptor n=1 Tax=Spongiibacter pelagi TaxID=2760804 RepID=A0A927GUY3_9GAMM|nr:TonB-dependent receptor [Spongiibacter pelagi]MBD2858091.1 TonB-dependent receptor [Spongiibacter pelagi]